MERESLGILKKGPCNWLFDATFASVPGKLIWTQGKSWNLAGVGQDGDARLELAPHSPASRALPPRGFWLPPPGAGLQGRTRQGESCGTLAQLGQRWACFRYLAWKMLLLGLALTMNKPRNLRNEMKDLLVAGVLHPNPSSQGGDPQTMASVSTGSQPGSGSP